MGKLAVRLAWLAVAAAMTAGTAWAQEPPAVANAKGAEKERIKGLIEEAKKEGGVTFIDAQITPITHDKLAAAFKKHYGLPETFNVGNTYAAPSGIITRLEQELRAGRVSFDVGAVASPAWVQARANEGHILKYASPEYPNYEKAISQQMGVKDMFVLNCAYTFQPTWNDDTLKFSGDSWKDMLKIVDMVPKGRFSTSDVGVTDSTLMVYIGLRRVLSLDDFSKIADHKPVYSYKSEQTLSRLVSGEDLFAMYGSGQRIYQFNNRGAHLKNLLPKEGLVMLPQMMWVFTKAPHPAAAKLWFDFMLSQEGQAILIANEYNRSGRTGFKSPHKFLPGIAESKTIQMDWLKFTEVDLQKARDEWATMFHGGKQRKKK